MSVSIKSSITGVILWTTCHASKGFGGQGVVEGAEPALGGSEASEGCSGWRVEQWPSSWALPSHTHAKLRRRAWVGCACFLPHLGRTTCLFAELQRDTLSLLSELRLYKNESPYIPQMKLAHLQIIN